MLCKENYCEVWTMGVFAKVLIYQDFFFFATNLRRIWNFLCKGTFKRVISVSS